MGQRDEKRIPILMSKTKRGGLDSRFPMEFKAGQVYMAPVSLANLFIRMNAAAISVIPATGCWHLKILADGISAEWELVIPEPA